jgi:hypothetical protein
VALRGISHFCVVSKCQKYKTVEAYISRDIQDGMKIPTYLISSCPWAMS